jgi:ribosomal subunit interface protein
MKTRIKATGIQLNDDLRKLVDLKIGGLNRFLPKNKDYEYLMEVEIGVTTKHHKKGEIFRSEAQVEMPGGKMLRGVSEKEDLKSSLTAVKEELQIQIKKYKDLGTIERKRKQRASKSKK